MTKLKLQEILRYLRYPNKLEDISEATGISVATLSRFESDDTKDIPYQSLLKLATHYDVSMDYLCGLTTLKQYDKPEISELYLTTKVIELLKNKKVNNRILCELLTNEDFIKLISAIEVYLDRSMSDATSNAKVAFDFMHKKLCEQFDMKNTDNAYAFLQEVSVTDSEYIRFKLSEKFNQIMIGVLSSYTSRFKVTDREKEKRKELETDLALIMEDDPKTIAQARAKVVVWVKKAGLNYSNLSDEEIKVAMKILERSPVFKNTRGGNHKKA